MSERDQKTTLSERLGKSGSFSSNKAEGSRNLSPEERQQAEVSRLLCGNLRDKPISWLLEVANHYKAYGQLNIGSLHYITEVHLEDGRPVHARSQMYTGTEALLELFIVSDGKVKFEGSSNSQERTIDESAVDLITLGEEYRVSIDFLRNNGINETSCLQKDFSEMDDMELESILFRGVKLDTGLQIAFFHAIDGNISLKQVQTQLNLPDSLWFIATANLLRLGLLLTPTGQSLKTDFGPEFENTDDNLNDIGGNLKQELSISIQTEKNNGDEGDGRSISVPPPQPFTAQIHNQTNKLLVTSGSGSVPKVINLGLPHHIIKLNGTRSVLAMTRMLDQETGVFDEDMFQFFLEKEFARAFRFGTDFALLIFSIVTDSNGGGFLPARALAYLLSSVYKIGRDVDVTGKLGERVYGFILPSVDSHQALNLALRINSELPGIAPDLAEWQPRLIFGSASVPLDAKDLTTLVECSQKAMLAAADRGKPMLAFNEV